VTTTATPAGPITVEVTSPAQLQAWQVTPETISMVAAWAGATWSTADDDGTVGAAVNLDDDRRAYLGDWVMRGILGNYFPVSPEFYAAHYRPAP
jgi:cyanate lyase